MFDIKSLFLNYKIDVNDDQIQQFEKFYNLLLQENQKYNLTAITEKIDVYTKHFIDSILPIQDIPLNSNVIDIGTGAGFPGIPLKILRPDIKLTLLDSLQKRINFLNLLVENLNLKDVKAIHARAEDYIKNNREKFDVAVSRAVASLPTLSEYLLPYIKIGGVAIMYKSNKLLEELNIGKTAIKELGGIIEKTEKFLIKEVDSLRYILFIKKIKHTNNIYPRGKNLPKTKPLIKKI